MSPEWLIGVWLVAVGLILGSYLNVVIHRMPRGQDTVLAPSACPACGARIRWYDNVPVLGWLLLRGRCRSCGAAISPRYVVVEILGASAVLAAWRFFGSTPRAAVAAVFLLTLIALAGIDREHFILPDRITYPLLILGLALAVLRPGWGFVASWRDAAGGALVGAAIPLTMIGLWLVLRGEEGMGLGDVKMLAGVGAVLGIERVLVTVFFASLVGSVVGIVGMALGRLHGKSHLPFGVFLAAGAAAALLIGRPLVEWYTGLL